MAIGLKDFQGSEDGDDEEDDHAAFPTLERALKTIDPHGGFNIEIKWDMELKVSNRTFSLSYLIYANPFPSRTALAKVTTRSSSASTSTSSSKQY